MKKEDKRVIISSVYSGRALKVIINKLSPDKLILIIDEPIDEKKKETIKELEKIFKNVIKFETLKTSLYEISEIAQKVSNKIDTEFEKGNNILLHITEGRKTVSFGMLFAGYIRKEKIKGIYYVIEENNQVLPLPIIDFSLRDSKKRLLQEINKGNGNLTNLIKKLEIKQSAIYQHIQELKQDGYIEENDGLKLTDFGRIIIL